MAASRIVPVTHVFPMSSSTLVQSHVSLRCGDTASLPLPPLPWRACHVCNHKANISLCVAILSNGVYNTTHSVALPAFFPHSVCNRESVPACQMPCTTPPSLLAALLSTFSLGWKPWSLEAASFHSPKSTTHSIADSPRRRVLSWLPFTFYFTPHYEVRATQAKHFSILPILQFLTSASTLHPARVSLNSHYHYHTNLPSTVAPYLQHANVSSPIFQKLSSPFLRSPITSLRRTLESGTPLTTTHARRLLYFHLFLAWRMPIVGNTFRFGLPGTLNRPEGLGLRTCKIWRRDFSVSGLTELDERVQCFMKWRWVWGCAAVWEDGRGGVGEKQWVLERSCLWRWNFWFMTYCL